MTSADDGVRSFDCDTCGDVDALVLVAKSRLEATGRQLTDAERERYLGG